MTPRIRFKAFHDIWEEVTLGDIGNFKNGLNKDKEDFGFGHPFVNLMDVFGKNSVERQEYSLVNASAKDLKLYNLLEGDVLFIRSSVKREGVGEAVLVLEDLPKTVFSGFLIRFREREQRLQLQYKKYCFSTRRFRNELLASATTSANTNINQNSLADLRLLIPTLPEQQKIAAFLGAVDRRVRELKRKQALLEQYKKGVVQQLFSQELRFKRKDGGEFPEWEEKRLGDVLTYEQPTKYIVKSTEYSDAYPTPVLTAGKTFILGYTDETKGIHSTEHPVIIFDDFTTANKFVDFPFKVKSSAMKILSCNPKQVSIKFVFEAMQLIDHVVGDHKRHWISIFEDIEIPFPSLEEQSRIAGFLMALDAKVAGVAQAVAAAQQWKKGLLQQMFV